MKADSDLDRQLRSLLREGLNREVGPDPTWAESPTARRVAEQERRARYRWPLRILAVAALIGAIGGAALLGGGAPDLTGVPNGWIAFTVTQDDPAGDPPGYDDDLDIWLGALDQEARRVIGTDTDTVRQLCPAFSPDGRSLAYGRVEGHGTQYSVLAPGDDRPAAYRDAALVVADVSADGHVFDRLTIDVGDDLPPPCPTWSPDGGQVAFGVNRTSPVNPETSAEGSEVWIVTLADQNVTVLPDLLATDLEWSPDGSLLAIASGVDERGSGGILEDGRIYLYAPSSGAMRSLDGTLGVGELTWSPDSQFIAYATGDSSHELRIIDVETERQRVVVDGYAAIHGIGPVWSPDGETIVYQRCGTTADASGCGGERHEVVLVTPGDLSDEGAAHEVIIPTPYLWPSRVTWSPDGEYLLYFESVIAAVPIDTDLPPVVLAAGDIQHYEGYPDTTFVPIQTWGRRPANDSSEPSASIRSQDEVVFEVGLHYYTSEGHSSVAKTMVPEPTPIHAQLPDGWVSTESGITNVPEEPDAPIAVSFWTVGAVFIDPCNQQTRADPPMMQTLDLLAGAFTHWWLPEARTSEWQPIPTQAVDTTVSGFRARYLEIRIPATVDMDRCGDGYVTWRNADNAPDNVKRRHTPGDVTRLWIVEVGPDRGTPPNSTPLTSTPLLVIDATSAGEASPEALRELEELIESVRIEAPEGLP